MPISIPMKVVLFYPSLEFPLMVCKMRVALDLAHPEGSHVIINCNEVKAIRLTTVLYRAQSVLKTVFNSLHQTL